MSDIEALLQPIETKIERLEGDHGSMFAKPLDAQLAAWEQVRATLLLAHEVNRIADILDTYHLDVTDKSTGDTYRVLGVGNVIGLGSYSF